jgi:glucose-1-phosphate thymidylyltransferase
MLSNNIKGLIVETTNLKKDLQPTVSFGGAAALTIYRTPLICFPFSFLLRRGVKDITMALTEDSILSAQKFFGDGSDYGVTIRYKTIDAPSFLAKEITEDANYYRGSKIIYISANTVLWGKEMRKSTTELIQSDFDQATIFGKRIGSPHNHETMILDLCGQIVSFEKCEEADNPDYSCLSIPKVGFYPADITEVVESLSESYIYKAHRPINQTYLNNGNLRHIYLHSKEIWSEVNSFDSIHRLSSEIYDYFHSQKIIIGSPELNAILGGLIDEVQFVKIIEKFKGTDYYDLLLENSMK